MRTSIIVFVALIATAVSIPAVNAPAINAQALPSGFESEVVLSGLVDPTSVEFAPDGRVFVAEKRGTVLVFDDLDDPTATVFADLTEQVNDFWDRGLLGLAIHPEFPAVPFVYVLYGVDAPPGEEPPFWFDGCGDPLGEGCEIYGRLSRLTADGDVAVGGEDVLLESWCQQYPSHSIGDIAFGADGALYVSAGDGASFLFPDHGQEGGNPCDDPPFEGGALRSQDLATTGDPVGLDGALLRLDAAGLPLPDNPLYGGDTSEDDGIIAYGLRNPYRLTVDPTTNEIWIGDVGWFSWEEINRVADPSDAVVENFGWPCYEGPLPHFLYDDEDLDICEDLYDTPGAETEPHYSYEHGTTPAPGSCLIGGSSITGLAIAPGGNYPEEYENALFFADFSRGCAWVMFADGAGVPDPANIEPFIIGAGEVVDLEIGPGDDLYYVRLDEGTVRRVVFQVTFIRGDCDGDGVVLLADPIYNLAYLFQGGPSICLDSQDVDDDGEVDLQDPVYGIEYLFLAGPVPPPPFGSAPAGCGVDPTADELSCTPESGACP